MQQRFFPCFCGFSFVKKTPVQVNNMGFYFDNICGGEFGLRGGAGTHFIVYDLFLFEKSASWLPCCCIRNNEFWRNPLGNDSVIVSLLQQFPNGTATNVAKVERPIVHVHTDELVRIVSL